MPGIVLTAKEKGMGELENDKIRIIPLHELWDPKLRGANWGTESLYQWRGGRWRIYKERGIDMNWGAEVELMATFV